MASFDRFLIAPFRSGAQTDREPWLIAEDAFQRLNNAYIFRDRIKKRFGTEWIGNDSNKTRLKEDIGDTDGSGNLAYVTLDGNVLNKGMMFSAGDILFTVTTVPTTTGGGGEEVTLSTDGTAVGTLELNSTSPNVYRFKISGGQSSIANTAVYWYPALPVMGLSQAEQTSINAETTIGFDTKFSYFINNDTWERFGTSTVFTGGNSDFFWTTNYRGATDDVTLFFAVNNVDTIHYFNTSSISTGTSWTALNPDTQSTGTNTLDSCAIIIPFKDRLIALNTLETVSGVGDKRFSNRCRYSQNGSPIASDAWHQDVGGKGGFIDASTKQAIVSAAFFRDRLLVFFEASSWELVYTGSEVLPFRWQQIDSELGCESTFSPIIFNDGVISVGNLGIHATNGQSVQRVDNKIPDVAFDILNDNNGKKRVHGVRNYFQEMVYWTYTDSVSGDTYPNKILAYNYKNQSWAFFDESFTCFGQHTKFNDYTWDTLPYETWDAWTVPWDSPISQAEFPAIIAGNQQGWTFVVSEEATEKIESLQITDISGSTLTIIDHNLQSGDYLYITSGEGVTDFNDKVSVVNYVDSDTIMIDRSTSQTYTGGAMATPLPVVDMITKRFNPYVEQGKNFFLEHAEFYVTATTAGEIAVDARLNSSELPLLESSARVGEEPLLETSPYALAAFESQQEKLWHSVYFGLSGENIAIRLYFNDEQMKDVEICNVSLLEIHAIMLYTKPTGRM